MITRQVKICPTCVHCTSYNLMGMTLRCDASDIPATICVRTVPIRDDDTLFTMLTPNDVCEQYERYE